MEVDLTNSELFDNFSEFEKDGFYIDLHNAFDCKTVEYSSRKKELIFSFLPNQYCSNGVMGVKVVFTGCIIDQYSATFEKNDSDFDTIDIMYRERFEASNGQLSEVFDSGQYYYSINFLPDVKFEVFANKVTAIVSFNSN